MSNLFISALKDFIPDKVRIPAFIVVIASFVTMVDLAMAAYVPALHKTLGIFIPLIVVNCIVLGRAEAFASRNSVISSLIDGLGMGLGFTFALIMLGCIREALGNGSVFGYKFINPTSNGILIFVLAPGAFITLGFLIAFINRFRKTS
jgi:electron transport complex protein RnfE